MVPRIYWGVTGYTCKNIAFLYLKTDFVFRNQIYGNPGYQLKKIVGSKNYLAQFIKIVSHYKKIGYN